VTIKPWLQLQLGSLQLETLVVTFVTKLGTVNKFCRKLVAFFQHVFKNDTEAAASLRQNLRIVLSLSLVTDVSMRVSICSCNHGLTVKFKL
jgi:hypothetical protein